MRAPPLRRTVVLAASIAVATAVAALSVLFYVVLVHRLDRDANDTLRSRAQAALATVAVRRGGLSLRESPRDGLLDQLVWLFADGRAVERPLAPASVQRAAAGLAAAGHPAIRDADADTRLLAEPVTERGRRLGMVVAAVSLAPYEHTTHIALIAVVVLDGVILLAFVLCARVLVRRALAPVAWMTAQATDWSEHDLDRRFALGPPHDELTALGATLDALLGRLGASLRHEQRFSSEMAHELRTPLTTLRGEAELALARGEATGMREALEAVLRLTDRISVVVDTLVSAAQRDADPRQGTVSAHAAAAAAGAACSDLAKERGMALDIAEGEPIEVDADSALTTQILVPVVENALRYGRSRVSIAYGREGESVVFRVIDDGPGVRPDELETIFAPGARGSAADGRLPGAGLGLALARRLARAAGGEIGTEPAGAGGRFAIRLPAS